MIGAATAQIPQQPPQQAASAASMRFSPSVANAVKVATVAQRLSRYLSADKGSGLGSGSGSSPSGGNPTEFVNLCLFLARGIDYAVANNEVLPTALELPALLRKICLPKDDGFNRAIIMVLMISVKNACKFKWFSEKDCQDLLALVDEIGKSFQIPRDIPVGSNASFSLVSIIMARFYPQLKMGQILTSLEVEPGYGAFVHDFAICKSMVHRPEEKVRLLVAQTDNIETSACIITPPQVSFLLNGRGVERRTNAFMDTGPQMPNNVAQMLKYGTNLLQAVGQFDGHYVVIIAFMSVASPPDSSTLSDYVPATIAAADSDSDIIEVASRICLNCPISRTRIQLPVKGQFCKHRQCFDYSNFLSINSRKPSWRCPHCNRPVCFTDIRVDRNIAKVLQEVGDDISEVTITVDGSWKAVMECNDDLYETPNVTLNFHKQGSEQQKSTVSPNTIPNVLDLTGDDDEMDGAFSSEPEDSKPLPSDFLIQSIPTNPSLPSALNNGRTVTQLAQSGNNLPGFVQTPSTSNAGQEMQIHGGLPQAISAIVTSASAGAVSPAPAQDAQFLGNANLMDCRMQTQLSVPNNLQIQQSTVVNTSVGHEYRSMPSILRHATITEGMQATPARAQTPSPLQRLRSMMMPGGPSTALPSTMSTTQPLEGFGSKGMHLERQQHISRPPVNPPEVSNIPPSALLRSSSMQDRFSTGQSVQVPPVVRPSPGQLQGRPRTSSGRFQTFQNSHLQQALNSATSPSTTHSPSMGRPILPRTPPPVSQAPGSSMFWPSTRQPAMPAQTPVQLQNQPSRMGSSLLESFWDSVGDQGANTGVLSPSSGGSAGELSVEQNWRPTRPMRGSISGRSHLDSDLNVIRPTQQAQVAPPPSAAGSASPTVPPHQRGPNPITGGISHLGYPPGTR